jgi:tRNA uridine 5-carboxymethylaminomethyl modification enzyme
MTARAEYRLLLRQDNADVRLTEMGRRVGLVTDERYDAFMRKREAVDTEKARLNILNVDIAKTNIVLAAKEQPPLSAPVKAAALLTRQGIRYADLKDVCGADAEEDVALCVETEIRYAGYIDKQQRQVDRFAAMERKKLPEGFDYRQIKGLRLEAAAKLTAARPETLGQAMRISGVSPADISVLTVFFSTYGKV